jgi:hypothetical protein
MGMLKSEHVKEKEKKGSDPFFPLLFSHSEYGFLFTKQPVTQPEARLCKMLVGGKSCADTKLLHDEGDTIGEQAGFILMLLEIRPACMKYGLVDVYKLYGRTA